MSSGYLPRWGTFHTFGLHMDLGIASMFYQGYSMDFVDQHLRHHCAEEIMKWPVITLEKTISIKKKDLLMRNNSQL